MENVSLNQLSQEESNVTFRDYVRVLFRQRSIIVLTIVCVCLTVFAGLKLKTKQYVASVKMLVTAEKQLESPYYKQLYATRNGQQTLTQSEIVKSAPVLDRVIQSLTLDKRPLDDEKKFASVLKGKVIDFQSDQLRKKMEPWPSEQKNAFLKRRAFENLRKAIKVEPIRDTNMFTISVKDYNPIAAAIIANVVSRSYIIFDLEQQLTELESKYGYKHPKVIQLHEYIVIMSQYLSGQPIPDIDAIGPASVKIIEQATVPFEPSGTPKMLTFILAVVMSVFLAVMLAFVFEYSDQTFKMPQDIQKTLSLPYVGSINRKPFLSRKLVNFEKRLSDYGRSYQTVCDQLYVMIKERNLKTLAVTSTLSEEQSPVVLANLATYFSSMLRQKVLLLDANFRAPVVHRLLKLKNEKGLADFLEGRNAPKEVVKKKNSHLDVITSGRTHLNPVMLLDSDKMKELMEMMKGQYDLVLINAPSIKGQKDTALVAPLADQLILVTDEGRTRRQVAKNAVEPLAMSGANILGVILNKRTFPIPQFIYERV